MDASCGPSSALSQLSKHTQRDQTLQNEFVGRHSHMQPGNFRSHGHIDAGLNREFQQFNSDTMGSFEPQFAAQRPNTGAPMAIRQNPNWVQDFNGLSLQEQRAQAVPQVQADWHQQFMQHQQSQNPQQQVGQNVQFQTGQSQFQSQYQSSGMYQGYRAGQYVQNAQLQQNVVHQDAVQILQPQNFDFDHHFDQVERELLEAEHTEEVTQIIPEDEAEKEKFAEAARQVKNLMISEKNLASEETTSKFQQLDFLKLMSLISERQVELSQEGDKLVEKHSGEDIRAHLSDPLLHEKETQPDYHQPVHQAEFNGHVTGDNPIITNESQNITSHLPDPLAHIKDGSLPDNLTPLQAARIISGGQVTASDWTEDESWNTTTSNLRHEKSGIMSQDWQDMYDDYRNEDDFH